jgi:ubiquinol-cytochrome c reductase iron-sulfur subunit
MSKTTKSNTPKTKETSPQDPSKRDFMVLSTQAICAIGAVTAVVPLVASMNPAADVKASASIEVDISAMQPGDEKKVKWRGKPVFIKRRTAEEIKEARQVNLNDLPDPQKDEDRVLKGKEEFLVVVGICTHLGCIPLGNDSGDYKAWFCPCHGSHYDTSGRIRKGPAPKNLLVPNYEFVSDTVIKIG